MKFLKALYIYLTTTLSIAFLLECINIGHKSLYETFIVAWLLSTGILYAISSELTNNN